MMTWAAQRQHNTVEDVDAMAATMADGLKSEFVQLEPGSFAAQWDVFRLGTMVVQFGCERLAVARRMRVPDDRWAFVIPLAVPGAARWNGVVIGRGELIVCAPRSEGYAFDPGGTRFVVVSVSPRAMPRLADAAISMAGVGQSCVIRPAAADLNALRDELASIEAVGARDIGSRQSSVDSHHPESARRAGRVSGLLLKCLCGESSRSLRTRDNRSAIVGRAEAFFRLHVGE